MGIEDFDSIDSSEGAGNSTEPTSEKASEKVKESEKKSGEKRKAQAAKAQKDEQKAKKYDLLLAGFLVKIILDKKYDFILYELFKAIDYGYPSNFILGIISLINPEISNKIREYYGKKEIEFNYKSIETLEFNSNNLPEEIKDRINNWIEDIIDSTTMEYSELQVKRIEQLLANDEQTIFEYIDKILIFFLKESNISIKKNDASGISGFIIGKVSKAMKNKVKISTE